MQIFSDAVHDAIVDVNSWVVRASASAVASASAFTYAAASVSASMDRCNSR